MKHQCDICGRPATIQITEINDGQKIEKHFCEECATSEGISIKANMPISKLLEDFVLQAAESSDSEIVTPNEPPCPICGLSFDDYKSENLLGCPNDYDMFESQLIGMISRTHKGATQHVGKFPDHADKTVQKQNTINRLRSELQQAVQVENYELAAKLRDQIKQVEQTI